MISDNGDFSPGRETLCRRFFLKVKVKEDTGCWLWGGGRRRSYGVVYVGVHPDGRRAYKSAHLLGYEMFHGPVPEGMELHHQCENKSCCRPHEDHVRAVTPFEHSMFLTYGNLAAVNFAKEFCDNGHPLVLENLRVSGLVRGERICIICDRERARRLIAKRRGQ